MAALPLIVDDIDASALANMPTHIDDEVTVARGRWGGARFVANQLRAIEANTLEENWQRRHGKRQEGIRCFKLSLTYSKLMILMSTGEISEGEAPPTPDWGDRAISHRQWERGLAIWRIRIRELVGRYEI